MSFEIKNIYFKKHKKWIFQNFSFIINNKNTLGINFENKKHMKYFLKIILGKKTIYKGEIYLNNQNITTNLPKNRNIILIMSSIFKINIFPIKLYLTNYLIKSPKFLHNAIINYLNNKYYLKKLLMINGDLFEKKIFHDIEQIIEKYIFDVIKIKNDWMNIYLLEIKSVYKKEIKKIFQINENTIIFQNIKNFIYKKEKLRVYEGFLSFLQSLFDKIKYIAELDYSCNCIILAKKKKLKNKCFSFKEIKLICQKYNKILKIDIWYERYKLFKYRNNVKKYYINIINLLYRENPINIKSKSLIYNFFNKKINFLLQLSKQKWYKYKYKQEQLISTLLPDEASIIKGKIIEKFHKYHIEILNQQIVYFHENISKDIEESKTRVVNIFNQAFNLIKELMFDLNIKITGLKIQKNLNNFDQIKIKLIYSILLKKQLIILNNIFDNLTEIQSIELINIINNIKIYNPKIIFLFLTKNIEYTKKYVNNFLFFYKNGKNEIINKEEDFLFPKYLNLYKLINNNFSNIFQINYYYNNSIIENKNFSFKLPKKKYLMKTGIYILAINPKLISFKQTKNYNIELNLIFNGIIKSLKKINESYISIFKINKKFYLNIITKNIYVNKVKNNTIYFEKGALLIYDKYNKQLIQII